MSLPLRRDELVATGSPRTFGIEQAAIRYGGFVDAHGAAIGVEFVWAVPAGVPGPDGVRVMLHGEPAGAGTYRLDNDVRYVIEMPCGIQVVDEVGALLYVSARMSTGLDSPIGP